MRRSRIAALALLTCLLAPACDRRSPAITSAPPVSFVVEKPRARILLIAETQGPGGAAADAARVLETLLGHFDETCDTVVAHRYDPGESNDYQAVFYLAGRPDHQARAEFAADVATHRGIITWVGAGVEALGQEALARLGIRKLEGSGISTEAANWTISYKGHRLLERAPVAGMAAGEAHRVLAWATRGSERRPFLCGSQGMWYAAAGPSLDADRFWTACVWADALHEILGRAHAGEPKRLVPVLRDVPIWTTAEQVPQAIQPMLKAGLPVGVMAWTNWGDVPLADRPEAVKGLRRGEEMGATIALTADTKLNPTEHFRLAWEVGLHPVAWAGPSHGENPFRLRIAPPEQSPPFAAGGLLPAPITISDAGYIAPEDGDRLRMLEVVRDAVALVSFGLWAPPQPFQSFLKEHSSRGWLGSDLRDFGVRVQDARRTMLSGAGQVRVAGGETVRRRTLGPDWKLEGEQTSTGSGAQVVTLEVTAPDRSVAVMELVNKRTARPFLKGVTLDPWAYSRPGASSEELAEMLAERYRENGVNTVFFYAYNVQEGAAYRTRCPGVTVSEWGKRDLLGHMLQACHARGIRVVAWLYSGRDRAMWKKHPDWRERTRDGKEYNPLRLHAPYFLCPRNPGMRKWSATLLSDLARRYPMLDGIELCEPVVNWFGDQACHCAVCRKEFATAHPGEPVGGEVWRGFRAQGLTDYLSTCMKAIADRGLDTYLMTISDAWSNGAILSPRRQAQESGLDLEALLDGPGPPDWVNFEIIWQQWAAIYGTAVFNYDWAEETTRRLVRRTDGRARVMVHLEMTDFGSQHMTPEKMAKTIERVKRTQLDGMECYQSRSLDARGAWPMLHQAYQELP